MVVQRKTLRSAFLYSAAVGGLMCASAAGAQTATSTTSSNASTVVGHDLQEVVVTANKRTERLHDVAMDISAVTGSDMQVRQQLDFIDFAAQVPGMNVEQTGVGGWNRLILRGQNSGGAGATVASVIDEMPLSFSGSDSNASLVSTNLATYDLQRVEVLKGPQGTLYGAAAEGGVIKYVTNPPDLTAFHAGGEIGGDTVEHGGAGGSAKGYINIPFWQDKAAFRLSGVYEATPGYVDNPYLGERNINRTNSLGFRASVLVKPTADLSIRATASVQNNHILGFNAEDVIGDPLTPFANGNKFNLANGYSNNLYYDQHDKNNLNYYSVDIEYDLHWSKLSSITSYGTVRNSFFRDFTSLEIAPGTTYGGYFGAVLYGEPIGLLERQKETLGKTNQEFRVSSEPDATLFGHKIDWVGGLFLTREDVVFDQLFDATTLPTATTPGTVLTTPPAGGAHFPSRFEEGALFGQIDYHLTPKFDIAVGGRVGYDTEQLLATAFCCVVDGNGGQEPLYKHHEQPDTWSVAPRWQITDATLVYGRIATGYRPGGPNLVPPGAGPDYNFYYQSDSTTNYELGLRSEFLHRSVTVDVAAFYVDWTNIQILSLFTAANGAVYGATGNAGAAISQGVEYNFTWTPIHNLTFGFLGSYTDAHLTQSAPGLGAVKGQSLAYVPKWNNTLNADYSWSPVEGYKAFVGATASFIGTRFTDFSSIALGDPHVKLPSYTTLALHAGVQNGPYTLEVYGKNLTDSKGISSYSGEGGQDLTGTATLITPRVIGVRLAVDY